MGGKPYKNDDDDPEKRLLRNILQKPFLAAQRIDADNRFIAALRERVPDLSKVRRALEDGANPDRIIHGGYPALHFAILRHDVPLVELLLKYDASVNDVGPRGMTALDEAYGIRFHEGIILLKYAGGKTAVTVPPDEDMIYTKDNYQTRINRELGYVLRYGNAREVQDALLLGADPNAEDPNGTYGHSLFHIAVYVADYDKVQKMIAGGADIHGKSPTGESAIDMLWWSEKGSIMTPQWFAIWNDLDARGVRTLFSKHPNDMTPNDLRAIASVSHCPNTTLMHHLVERGQADFVLGILKKHPSEALTAEDLRRKSDRRRNGTGGDEMLLEVLARAEKLDEVFTSDIWQGRLEEMLSLKKEVERWPIMRRQVDFNRAAEDVRARRYHDLHAMTKKAALKPKDIRP